VPYPPPEVSGGGTHPGGAGGSPARAHGVGATRRHPARPPRSGRSRPAGRSDR